MSWPPSHNLPFVLDYSNSAGLYPNERLSEYRPLQTTISNPRFEQKGVDMRIGLDIAHYATNRSVDQIVLITARYRLPAGTEARAHRRPSGDDCAAS